MDLDYFRNPSKKDVQTFADAFGEAVVRLMRTRRPLYVFRPENGICRIEDAEDLLFVTATYIDEWAAPAYDLEIRWPTDPKHKEFNDDWIKRDIAGQLIKSGAAARAITFDGPTYTPADLDSFCCAIADAVVEFQKTGEQLGVDPPWNGSPASFGEPGGMQPILPVLINNKWKEVLAVDVPIDLTGAPLRDAVYDQLRSSILPLQLLNEWWEESKFE